MARKTRLGPDGYGVRPTGSFVGKGGVGGGPHPVTRITRLGLEGYGVRRSGSFSGKSGAPASGPHPVGVLTRLGPAGYGIKRAGSFASKTPGATTTIKSRRQFGSRIGSRQVI